MKHIISETAAIQVLLAGLALYVLMMIFRRLIKNRLRAKNAWRFYDRYSPLVYAGIWASFFYWAVYVVVENETYESLILLSILVPLIAGLAWYAGRDFLAGIIIKTQSPFAKGQLIVFGENKGVVMDRGVLRLGIRSDSGAIIRIPYSQLISEPQKTEDSHNAAYTHHFRVPLSDPGDKSGLVEQLRIHILNCPWSVPYFAPEIRLISQEGLREIDVISHVYSKEQGIRLEEELRALCLENRL